MKPIYDYVLNMSDFKGRAAFTLFFTGCNLRCSFCCNKQIVEGPGRYTLDEMKTHIDSALYFERKDFLERTGVVFSGGEPTLSTYFNEAVNMFKDRPLGIHTNGLILPKYENPFEAVVLSIKPTGQRSGLHNGWYLEQISRAMKYYRGAKHKMIRLVDAPVEGPVDAIDMALSLFEFVPTVCDDWEVYLTKDIRDEAEKEMRWKGGEVCDQREG